MALNERAQSSGKGKDAGAPIRPGLELALEARPGRVEGAVKDVVLVGDVLVQRHALDAELSPESVHAQSRQSVFFDVAQSSSNDARATERNALGDAFLSTINCN